MRKIPYSKIVRWSEEDGCYVGTCPELFFGGVHGPNEMKVYRELSQMVSEMMKLGAARTRPSTRRTTSHRASR